MSDKKTALKKAIKDLENLRVLFVGETIIDEYKYVLPLGKTPKEHMIATLYKESERFTGGIVAAAKHLSGFCGNVHIATNGEPHIVKSRYVDPTYTRKLFEVYHLPPDELLVEWRANFYHELEVSLPVYDVVIVIDYGHGLISKDTADLICAKSKFLAVNTQSNSANWGFNVIEKYNNADLICLDAAEARLATRDNHSPIEDIAGIYLPKVSAATHHIVTHGKNGCIYYGNKEPVTIPAITQKVTDTMGAGDAFLAICAPLLASGLDPELAALAGNLAGGLKTSIIGHKNSVDPDDFMNLLEGTDI